MIVLWVILSSNTIIVDSCTLLLLQFNWSDFEILTMQWYRLSLILHNIPYQFNVLLDHRRIIGFSFDSKQAAAELWSHLQRLISNPENIALSAPGRKRKSPKKQKIILPPKSQISLPCQFNHITNVTRDDRQRYFSLQAFLPSTNKR